jgi:hypothetical protein
MSPSNWSALLAPFAAAVMTLFSVLIYRYWEIPAKRRLLDLAWPLLARLRNGSWLSYRGCHPDTGYALVASADRDAPGRWQSSRSSTGLRD